MKSSDLIKELLKIMGTEGDMDVYFWDSHYGQLGFFEIKDVIIDDGQKIVRLL